MQLCEAFLHFSAYCFGFLPTAPSVSSDLSGKNVQQYQFMTFIHCVLSHTLGGDLSKFRYWKGTKGACCQWFIWCFCFLNTKWWSLEKMYLVNSSEFLWPINQTLKSKIYINICSRMEGVSQGHNKGNKCRFLSVLSRRTKMSYIHEKVSSQMFWCVLCKGYDNWPCLFFFFIYIVCFYEVFCSGKVWKIVFYEKLY